MLVVKNPPVNAGDIRDASLIPVSGRSPGGGHGNPLQYSCLENPKGRGAWWATGHGVTKSRTQLKWLSMHTHFRNRSHPLLEFQLWLCKGFSNQSLSVTSSPIRAYNYLNIASSKINSILSASLPFLLKLSAIPSSNKTPSLCILPLLNPNFQLATKSNVFSQENISLIHSLLCLLTTSTQILVFSISYTKTVLL